MNIYEAAKEFDNNQRITRDYWNNDNEISWLGIYNDKVFLYKAMKKKNYKNKAIVWQPTQEDLLANDYRLLSQNDWLRIEMTINNG